MTEVSNKQQRKKLLDTVTLILMLVLGISGIFLVSGATEISYDIRSRSFERTDRQPESMSPTPSGQSQVTIDSSTPSPPLRRNQKTHLDPTAKIDDANLDNRVDGTDYVIWFTHFGTNTQNKNRDGDFDFNVVVNGIDYALWVNHYGT